MPGTLQLASGLPQTAEELLLRNTRVGDVFELRSCPYDHPDAVALTERAQAYYVGIYGGRDDDPLNATDFRLPAGGFVVGYADGSPIAMGGWTFAGEPGPPVAHLRRMFVDASARRRGWAGAILNALETEAAARAATSVILSTGRPQVEAIAFYRSSGYTDVPVFGYYAGSQGVVCLGKRITAL